MSKIGSLVSWAKRVCISRWLKDFTFSIAAETAGGMWHEAWGRQRFVSRSVNCLMTVSIIEHNWKTRGVSNRATHHQRHRLKKLVLFSVSFVYTLFCQYTLTHTGVMGQSNILPCNVWQILPLLLLLLPILQWVLLISKQQEKQINMHTLFQLISEWVILSLCDSSFIHSSLPLPLCRFLFASCNKFVKQKRQATTITTTTAELATVPRN